MAVTAGQMYAVAGLINSYGQAQAQKAQGIMQETAYLLQARDTLAVAQVRAEMDPIYAQIQAGRIIKKAEIEAQNYQIAGNTLLKNLRATNAAARARAAASGVAMGAGGSVEAIQRENTANAMRDVAIADLNGLTARVLGFEDATALLQSTEMQNILNLYTAKRQSGQYEQAGSAARKTFGLLADATLVSGAVEFGKTFPGKTT